MQTLPKIAVLATGGTIAGIANPDGKPGYAAGVLPVRQLLQAVPDIGNVAQIDAEQVANIDSSKMTVAVWLELARRVNERLAGDTDGVVVAHGTDTMEETAYFLDLVVKSRKPVVLTGAMRPATAVDADGPANLRDAILLAASREAEGRGVLVVLDGTIHAARDVTKMDTARLDAFRSPNSGPLGHIVKNRPSFNRAVARAHTMNAEFDVSDLTELPKVEIVHSYAGAGADAVRGVVAGGAAGIVVGGVGIGLIADDVENALIDAVKSGIMVVRSSRVEGGIVAREADDDARGFVAAGDLNPWKARVLLMLALTWTRDPARIQAMFDRSYPADS